MIYNYLISDYVSRENSRYYSSTHKKSELKKIYNDSVYEYRNKSILK